MASNFQLDTLVKGVQGLQQERVNLEKALQTMRSRKRNLEDRLDKISARHGQVKDINSKMRETLKVAQYKVTQTYGQLATLDETYKRNKQCVTTITQNIEQERNNQLNETSKFEGRLAEIAKKLKGARNFHSPQNLEDEITKISSCVDQLLQEIETTTKEAENLENQRQDLERNESKDSAEIEAADQRMTLEVLQEEGRSITVVGEKQEILRAQLLKQLEQVKHTDME